ncbi:DUF4097 family beta strand repeat-containing protein [Paenibacillus bouchesdurhonensis]|uniref:DUF4097 family beta strand repeat-containing protein n=1 Tax=Paenibacillus bouchesdurhonensis TaxID=1870990 RepID=UPI000DA5FEDE|nr:DUF4097 family beta strand repeat-containing protein [Paenibacillus bouchesdurhonensis]
MNKKGLTLIATILVILGIGGMFYQGFNFGEEQPPYTQKWTFSDNELKSLSIHSDYNVELEFIASPDGTNYVESRGNLPQQSIDKLMETKIANQSLALQLREERVISFLSFGFNSTTQQITVALADPEQSLDQITVDLMANDGNFKALRAKEILLETKSGNLEGKDLEADRLQVGALSGKISLEEIAADTELRVTSGNVEINHLQGSLTSKMTSGDFTVQNLQGDIQAAMTSGNIKVGNWTGNGTFKSTSGNITIKDQRSDTVDITIQSGNVRLSADPEFQGIYDLRTSSGNIKSPDSPNVNHDIIKVRSTSGNITIE